MGTIVKIIGFILVGIPMTLLGAYVFFELALNTLGPLSVSLGIPSIIFVVAVLGLVRLIDFLTRNW